MRQILSLRLISNRATPICIGLVAMLFGLGPLLAAIFGEKANIQRSSKNPFELSLSYVLDSNSRQFVSLGRPKGSCDVSVNGTLYSKNGYSENGVRDNLFIGFTIEPQKIGKTISLDIKCLDQRGFPSSLTEDPLIAVRPVGVLIHYLRVSSHLLFGPGAALLCIALVIFSIGSTGLAVTDSIYKNYLIFLITSLVYLCSLAHIPRLVLEPYASSFLHIFVRYLFSMTFVHLVAKERIRSISIGVHSLLLGAAFSIHLVSPDLLVEFYKTSFAALFLITIVPAFSALLSKSSDSRDLQLGRILLLWSFSQLLDIRLLLDFRIGQNSGPFFVTVVTLSSLISYSAEIRRRVDGRMLSSRLIDRISAAKKLSELVPVVADSIRKFTELARVSVYVDSVCLGKTDLPERRWTRVYEDGYLKLTVTDREIGHDDDRGKKIFEAIALQKSILGKGREKNAWYILLPLEKYGCISISDISVGSTASILDIFNSINALDPALKSFTGFLRNIAFREKSNLAELVQTYGAGESEVYAASFFSDINDFSLLESKFGEAFSDFVRSRYYPSLVKALSEVCQPEYFSGDEILVHVLARKDSKELDFTQIAKALRSFTKFVEVDGKEICKLNGFPALSFSSGLSGGKCRLVVDDYDVSLIGRSLVNARRLQSGAKMGQFLIDSELTIGLVGQGLSLAEEFSIQVKKDLIKVRELELEKPNYSVTSEDFIFSEY